MTPRATKIVATLGPASNTPEILQAIIEAGVNVVRLNFSHGTADEHRQRAAMVRAAAQSAGRVVGIMADLQGPKIRVGKFAQGRVQLQTGQPFVLDAALVDALVVGELAALQHLGVHRRALEAQPVSYTHLTLPTICSV